MRPLARRLRQEHGISLIEVMVAMILLTVGILALLSSFTAAQKLTLVAERRTALTHRAQQQLERLESYGYSELSMSTAPAHAAGTPDEYVDYNNPVKCKEVDKGGCFAWNAKAATEEAPLVVSSSGVVSASPEAWSTGNVSGETYAFVTWANDAVCKEICPSEDDYKRITVVVTATLPAGTNAMTPVRVSTVIANPNAAPSEKTPLNPLKVITCGGTKCTSGIGSGNAQSWFLHDYAASSSASEPTTGGQETHDTVAPSNTKSCEGSTHSGCPQPDLMSSEVPTAEKLQDYSIGLDSLGETITPPVGTSCPAEEPGGVGTGCFGGRALKAGGVECGVEPKITEAEANLKSEMWVTPPLEAETTLTGSGGLEIYSQTLKGLALPATLCVALYRVSDNIEALWDTETPKIVAWTSYTPEGADWPSSLEQISFDFEPTSARTLKEPGTGSVVGASGSEAVTLKSGERLGLRVWPLDNAISIVYGTGGRTETIEGVETEVARYPAQLQLNTE